MTANGYSLSPLRKSIYRKLAASVPSTADKEDLVNFIDEQFVKLVKEYDPMSGVDFPGYISKMLLIRAKGLYVRPVNRGHERRSPGQQTRKSLVKLTILCP